MAISLTHIDTKQSSSRDGSSKQYKAVITGTYPSGGYEIANAQYPSAEQVFQKIKRAFLPEGGMDADGYIYRIDVDDFDNSSSSDPLFYVRVYEMITGGAGYTELSAGTAHTATIYLVIEGILKNHVDSDPW